MEKVIINVIKVKVPRGGNRRFINRGGEGSLGDLVAVSLPSIGYRAEHCSRISDIRLIPFLRTFWLLIECGNRTGPLWKKIDSVIRYSVVNGHGNCNCV